MSLSTHQGNAELSSDLNVITAEIKAFKKVSGEAIFEIGRRLKYVKEKDLVHGEWSKWCESEINMSRKNADKFIKVFDKLGGNDSTSSQIGMSALYEIATIPDEQRQFPHKVPSTGETKTVNEMTVRELREVKKALKEAQQAKEFAEKEADILRSANERLMDQPPKVEVKTEYIERGVVDNSAEEKLRKYESMFGDISMYTENASRVSNGDAITYSVFEFTEDARKFVEKYGHLTHFAKEFNGMIPEGKGEYLKAIQSMFSLLKSIERNLDENVVIINQ